MDPLRIHAYKIHAIKKHKRQQFVTTILLYSFSTLACTLFCSSPLWYPPFCATFNVLFFFKLPKICSFFFTSKVLFVVGNLIVIFLVGQSKASRTSYSDVCYDKYKCKSPEPGPGPGPGPGAQVLSPPQTKKGRGVAKCEKKLERKVNVDTVRGYREKVKIVEEEVILPAEELNKLADDFIARINRQRRLEAEFSMG